MVKRLLAVLALVCATNATALADPTNDIKNAFLNLAGATSYHIDASADGHAMQGDFVKPGKLHMTFGPMEMIEIDKTTYVKMQGTWRQFTFPGLDRLTQPFALAQRYATKATTDISVTDLGMKTVAGATLHAYLVKDTADNRTSTMYIDANSMPARIEVDGEHGPQVITFSNINGPITIVAPI